MKSIVLVTPPGGFLMESISEVLSTLWNIGGLCIPLLFVVVSAYKTGKKRQTKTTIFFPRKEKKEQRKKKRYAGHTAM
jgi:hypothetical protein